MCENAVLVITVILFGQLKSKSFGNFQTGKVTKLK